MKLYETQTLWPKEESPTERICRDEAVTVVLWEDVVNLQAQLDRALIALQSGCLNVECKTGDVCRECKYIMEGK